MELELILGVLAAFFLLISNLGHPSTVVVPKKSERLSIEEAMKNVFSVRVTESLVQMSSESFETMSENQFAMEAEVDNDPVYYAPAEEAVAMAVSESVPAAKSSSKEAWEVEYEEFVVQEKKKDNVIQFRPREELKAARKNGEGEV